MVLARREDDGEGVAVMSGWDEWNEWLDKPR